MGRSTKTARVLSVLSGRDPEDGAALAASGEYGTFPGVFDLEAETTEILSLQRQAGEAVLAIGKRLIYVKEHLDHGEWLNWLAERVGYSERSAQNFMRLSREWTNPQPVADLGYRKALALLALPSGEREAFLAEAHEAGGKTKTVREMSARELETAIRERDAARQEREAANRERDAAVREKNRFERRVKYLEGRPVVTEAVVKPDEDALDHARREGAEEAAEPLRKELAVLREELDRARQTAKSTEISSDADLAVFNLAFREAQRNAEAMGEILAKVRGRDAALGEKLGAALTALAEKIGGFVS